MDIIVGLVTVEVELVVYKIVDTTVVLQFKHARILASPADIDIDVVDVLHLVLILLRYAFV